MVIMVAADLGSSVKISATVPSKTKKMNDTVTFIIVCWYEF